MEFLQQDHVPSDLNKPLMLFAFRGWADAAESATHALRYLVRHLAAKKFAEIDPEEFYNFTRVRPQTRLDSEGNRYIQWPRNRFFYHRAEAGGRDVVIFIGIEPNLRWATFTREMIRVIQRAGVTAGRASQVPRLVRSFRRCFTGFRCGARSTPGPPE